MWVNTYHGHTVDFNNPRPDQIDVRDIAKALSRICRYTGHTKEFYSVAQHSVIVAQLVETMTLDKEKALAGLLHEAPEAYGMSDIHGTFKRSLGSEAKGVIKGFEGKIFQALGFDEHLPEEVDYVDSMVLVDEMRQLFTTSILDSIDFKDNKKYGKCEGYGIDIVPWPSEMAERIFLDYYYHLIGEQENVSEPFKY